MHIKVAAFNSIFNHGIAQSVGASAMHALSKRDSIKKNPESLLVVSLGKEFNETPSHLSGRQVTRTVSVIIENKIKNVQPNFRNFGGSESGSG